MPSWLWILIVVILILWIAGLIALPLGGLVNLLLLVVLILVIIWLLQRIRRT
jgi:hypothetical protein